VMQHALALSLHAAQLEMQGKLSIGRRRLNSCERWSRSERLDEAHEGYGRKSGKEARGRGGVCCAGRHPQLLRKASIVGQ
jgi:hypothetical protein